MNAHEAEERRKLYVAATRAEEILVLSGNASFVEVSGEPLQIACAHLQATGHTESIHLWEEWRIVVDRWMSLEPDPSLSPRPSIEPDTTIDGEKSPEKASPSVDDSTLNTLRKAMSALAQAPRMVGSTSEVPFPHLDTFSLLDIQAYERCPRLFFWRQFHLAPLGAALENGVSAQPPDMESQRLRGILVHHVLRLFHSSVPPEAGLKERWSIAKEWVFRISMLMEIAETPISRQAESIVQRYLDHPLSRIRPWLQEAEVHVRFSGKSGPFHVRGFADRVDREELSIHVIDYKTRAYHPTAHQAYINHIALYVTAARHGILGEVGHLNFASASILYLTESEARLEPVHPDLSSFESWATSLVDALRQETRFNPHPHSPCSTCLYAVLCNIPPHNIQESRSIASSDPPPFDPVEIFWEGEDVI